MITITATDSVAVVIATVEAKSISGAWNKIREIRDQYKDEQNKADGIIITINMGELPVSDRLPLEIIFIRNTSGKIEFKDLAKLQARKTAKKDAEVEENYPDQGEEYMEKDLALSAL